MEKRNHSGTPISIEKAYRQRFYERMNVDKLQNGRETMTNKEIDRDKKRQQSLDQASRQPRYLHH